MEFALPIIVIDCGRLMVSHFSHYCYGGIGEAVGYLSNGSPWPSRPASEGNAVMNGLLSIEIPRGDEIVDLSAKYSLTEKFTARR